MKELYHLCGITKIETAPYAPSSNGLTERMNRLITDHLAMLVDPAQRDWDELIPYVLFAIRTTKQASTGETSY